MKPLAVFHCSDLHFGPPAIPEQHEALLNLIRERRFDVVAISGDLTQRAFARQFKQARAFIDEAGRYSKVIAVPGNHDVAWWFAPLGLGAHAMLHHNYRRFINPDLEPVLRVPGATFVGINTSHGISLGTLTWRLRDLSIIGHVREEQLARAEAEFARSPADDARVVMLHHNVLRGELSRRRGLSNSGRVDAALEAMKVDLVLCGHDHQESVQAVEHPTKKMTVSTAGTVSNRSRGGRPCSVNSIHIESGAMRVETLSWSEGQRAFEVSAKQGFAR